MVSQNPRRPHQVISTNGRALPTNYGRTVDLVAVWRLTQPLFDLVLEGFSVQVSDGGINEDAEGHACVYISETGTLPSINADTIPAAWDITSHPVWSRFSAFADKEIAAHEFATPLVLRAGTYMFLAIPGISLTGRVAFAFHGTIV